MEKVAPNLKSLGHSTEIIQQSKIKGPLRVGVIYLKFKNAIDNMYFSSRQFASSSSDYLLKCSNERTASSQKIIP